MGSESRVVSIETGFTCNAYCAFCPQISYRDDPDPDVPLDLTTEEIRQRIRYGAEHGYRQVGFSGGEVTIRPDLLDLVRYAKSLEYELIAVTTNGMMLGYPKYAAALLHAGVNSVNVSVLGHDAKTHDAMMRTPGSFEMALKGIDNVRALAERTRTRLDMMSMCIASPQVIDQFPEHVALMGRHGIRLHMLQPFLMTKGNTQAARSYMCSYDRIEAAIREGARVARRHGGHVKLFNTPVCSFWDIEEDLERQERKLDVFREHRSDRAEPVQRSTGPGYYRVEACATCDEPCPGFRAEYYPQEKMAAEVCAAIDAHVASGGSRETWLAGLELMTAPTMQTVLAHARASGAARVVVLTAGIGRAYHDQHDRSVLEHVDEVCLVLHPPRRDARDFGDRHTSHGNFDDLSRAVEAVGRAGLGTPLSASVSIGQLDGCPSLGARLQAWGVRALHVHASPEPPGQGPWWARGDRLPRLRALGEAGLRVSLLGRDVPGDLGVLWFDPSPRFVRHPWTGRHFEWINWSVPWWVHFDDLLTRDGFRRSLPIAPGRPAAAASDGE